MGLVPCLLPISVCPAPWLVFSHFPSARVPGASSLCPLLSAHMPGSLPFWHAPVCPCGVRAPSAPPWASGLLGRRQRARSGKQARRKHKRKRKLCRALLPILRGRWAGVLACSRNRSSRRPVFPSELRLSVRARALSLTHSLSLTLIRSISSLRAYFGAVFCENEVCRRRRREKKVGSSS